MSRPSTFFSSGFSRLALLGGAIGILGLLATVSAQYRSSYPYSRPPSTSRQLPNTARHVGGLIGNPYGSRRTAPTGMPVSGNRHSYYGGGGGSSFTQRSTAKPFSNLQRPQALVTSRDAARIEVSRGLWHW